MYGFAVCLASATSDLNMSLFKFGFVSSKPNTNLVLDTKKDGKSKQEKDRQYDQLKRKRTAVDAWSQEFEWLEVQNDGEITKLFCK